MQSNAQDAERLFAQAITALREGRANDARNYSEQLSAIQQTNPNSWLLLATTCRAQQDNAAEESALDRLLALEPRSVRGLIMKGDCRARESDDQAAAGFYRAAVMIGETKEQPAPVVEELRRAQAALARFKEGYQNALEAALASHGLSPDGWSPRFRQSMDIRSGRKDVFLQQPTGYFFPELPHIQFYDPSDFEWTAAIEAETSAIRQEILAIMAAGTKGFRPYIQSDSNQPRLDENPLLDSIDWSALFLCENGEVSEELVARCPKTWAALQATPLMRVNHVGPTAMFSLLRAGAHIKPHTGVSNTRLTCHLPLIVPNGCAFRVGNQIRQWKVGKLLVFDDTIEHEAWNNGTEDRIVLIFDVWRPELSETERREVAALLAFR